MFQPRERNLEYSIGHYDDKWYIRTNKDVAKNFKVMITPEAVSYTHLTLPTILLV